MTEQLLHAAVRLVTINLKNEASKDVTKWVACFVLTSEGKTIAGKALFCDR